VIFDCDGVLVDSEILAIEVEIVLLAECGLVYPPDDYRHRFLGLNDAAFREALARDCQDAHGPAAARGLPAPGARPALGRLPDPPHRGRRLRRRPWRSLSLPRAVASSSGAAFLREKLRLTGLLDAFDPHVYSADLVARAKPHPDVFLHAAEALGRRAGSLPGHRGQRQRRPVGPGGRHGGLGLRRRRPHGRRRVSPAVEAGADRLVADWDEARALFEAFG
jgi:beta-phosphoglucomutase-like phosphatase (HAD superfamily)